MQSATRECKFPVASAAQDISRASIILASTVAGKDDARQKKIAMTASAIAIVTLVWHASDCLPSCQALGVFLTWWRACQDRPTWMAAIEKLLRRT